MFLVTSADQRYWDKSQDLLFLHGGCKPFLQKKEMEGIKCRVLPYPCEDTLKYSNNIKYIEKLSNKIIPILRRELNEIHNVEHSERYWKIIIYPGLFSQINSLYDRYQMIKSAKKSNLVTDTYVLKCRDISKIVPTYPWGNYLQYYNSDEYNQYIYGKIIENIDAVPYTVIDYQPNISAYMPQKCFSVASSGTNLLKKICITINDKISAPLSLKYNKIQIINPYMSNTDIIRLNLKLMQFPSIINRIPIELDETICSLDLRNMIKEDLLLLLSENEFEQLFCTLLPELLPKVFLENFNQISKFIQKYTNNAKIIYAANGYFDPELLIYAAEICDQNDGKIIMTQHGGSFGSSLYNYQETIQKEISDNYLSWGWEDKSYQNVIAMSTASKFNYIKDIGTNRKHLGKILLIETDRSRSTCGAGGLSAYSFSNYIDNQFIFYDQLSNDVKKLSIIRLFPEDHWDFRMQWADKFPDADTDSKGKSFYELLKDCRLAINSTNDTTFLECLVGNIPTILFHNPKYEPIRPEAQPYYDMLHNAGIIHYTPESAAKLVNKIYEDPMKWWMQPEIQEAKDKFCYHFARTSDDALDQLAKFLKEEYAKIAK